MYYSLNLEIICTPYSNFPGRDRMNTERQRRLTTTKTTTLYRKGLLWRASDHALQQGWRRKQSTMDDPRPCSGGGDSERWWSPCSTPDQPIVRDQTSGSLGSMMGILLRYGNGYRVLCIIQKSYCMHFVARTGRNREKTVNRCVWLISRSALYKRTLDDDDDDGRERSTTITQLLWIAFLWEKVGNV